MSTTHFGSFLVGAFVGAFGIAAWTAYQEEHRQEILDRFKKGPEVHHSSFEYDCESNADKQDAKQVKDGYFANKVDLLDSMMKDIVSALGENDINQAKMHFDKYKTVLANLNHGIVHEIEEMIKEAETIKPEETIGQKDGGGVRHYKISEDPTASINI